ncbi:MAG: glutamine amidotransferase [Acutalibacteraceae bacterium]|nr:glutamine amidotransferase [Oscillospiraceae bacterium]
MEIKILHLYYDLLNLYGEYGNVSALERYLENQGAAVTVDRLSLYDDVDFKQYDFIYIGSGTEEKQLVALENLKKTKADIRSAYDSGAIILATGNAFEMFGKKIISPDGSQTGGLGWFDIETSVSDKKRTLTDEICSAGFLDKPCVGFINKASEITSREKPMFVCDFGAGNSDKDKNEGIVNGSFYGTHLTGPCLVKNPHLLEYFAGLIAKKKGFDLKPAELPFENRAYKITLEALKSRMN